MWISYEDMHRDPEGSIRRVADFLDRPLTDDQVYKKKKQVDKLNRLFNKTENINSLLLQVRRIAVHTSFEQMAQNPSVNYSHWDDLGLRDKNEAHFMRQGRVGDWRRHFDVETNKRFDDYIHEQLADSGMTFEYLPAAESKP